MNERGTMKRRNAGYSLVEVLIAIAITGIVLLTVVTLFYMGRRNVYSGKQMTYAVSVGTRIMEDLSTMTTQDINTAFNLVDGTTSATGSVTVPCICANGAITYANSVGRDTTMAGGANDPNGYLTQWASIIDQSKLTNGKVGLVITPRSPSDTNKPWSTARFTRVRAYVQWDEAKNRTRTAFFDTTKVNRE